MKAYKCDRCGKLFENKIASREYLITKANLTIRNCWLDLCEDCQDRLDNWMNIYKESEPQESEVKE